MIVFRYFDASGALWDICAWPTIRKGLEWRRYHANKRAIRILAFQDNDSEDAIHEWKYDYINKRMKRIK